ncbi:hypothetical protein BaRGS_00027139 [Batillaria attramentaria]|uniref:Uncharacterized protein n=1 Tax=Batillaria attramentaria TaxID=370345 RepID=A0ABD0K3I4_9CAEN
MTFYTNKNNNSSFTRSPVSPSRQVSVVQPLERHLAYRLHSQFTQTLYTAFQQVASSLRIYNIWSAASLFCLKGSVGVQLQAVIFCRKFLPGAILKSLTSLRSYVDSSLLSVRLSAGMLPYNHYAFDRRYAVPPHGRPHSAVVNRGGPPQIPIPKRQGAGRRHYPHTGHFQVQDGSFHPGPYSNIYHDFDFPRGGGGDNGYNPYAHSSRNPHDSYGTNNVDDGMSQIKPTHLQFSSTSHLK